MRRTGMREAGRRDPGSRENGPGVPEALSRTVRVVADELGHASIDRLWIFPPLRRGRREWGLVVVGEFLEDDERRRLHTARYAAEATSSGVAYEVDVTEEGILPPDRFSRVLSGVVRRMEEDLGDPRSVEIAGSTEAVEELLKELTPPDLEAWQE